MYFLLSKQLNLDRLLARMWDEMGLVRVYTKPQGQQPDFTDPVVLSHVSSSLCQCEPCKLCFPAWPSTIYYFGRTIYSYDIDVYFLIIQDRGGCNVEDFCNHIHRSLVKDVKYVLVWGTSARHYPQHCGLSHSLLDEDVVQIVKKKVYNLIFLQWLVVDIKLYGLILLLVSFFLQQVS